MEHSQDRLPGHMSRTLRKDVDSTHVCRIARQHAEEQGEDEKVRSPEGNHVLVDQRHPGIRPGAGYLEDGEPTVHNVATEFEIRGGTMTYQMGEIFRCCIGGKKTSLYWLASAIYGVIRRMATARRPK